MRDAASASSEEDCIDAGLVPGLTSAEKAELTAAKAADRRAGGAPAGK